MRSAFALGLGLAAASVICVSATKAQTQSEPFSWEHKTNKLLQPKRFDRLGHTCRVLNRDVRELKLSKVQIFSFAA